MQPMNLGWTKWLLCCLSLLLLTAAGMTAAQLTEQLQIGEERGGEITKTQPTARFAIAVTGTETLDIRVSAADSGLTPWFRVRDQMSGLVARVPNPGASANVSAVVPLPEAGVYFIEVGGEDKTTGAFTILVGLGPSVPGATVLRPGDTAEGLVSEAAPEQVYDINSSVEGELLVLVRGASSDAGPEVELRNEIVDQTIGTGGALLSGVGFVLHRGDSLYSLRVRYSGSAPNEAYTVCVARVQAVAGCFAETGADESA